MTACEICDQPASIKAVFFGAVIVRCDKCIAEPVLLVDPETLVTVTVVEPNWVVKGQVMWVESDSL